MALKLPASVKRTSGATFDPEAPFSYFIASSPEIVRQTDDYPTVLLAVNELANQSNRKKFRQILNTDAKVFLDSGIFNLAMEYVRKHGVTHDHALGLAPEEIDGFDQLWNLYGEIVTEYKDRLWGVVELDQGGKENKRRTRARIEKEIGVVPIPVYHPLLDGWDYYDELAGRYDRMCFGNIVKAPPNVRLRLAHTAMERARGYPYLWTHLLGLSMTANLLAIPFRGSCDSSAWLRGVRWSHSWTATAMLKSVSKYSPSMWTDKATLGEHYDSVRSLRICSNIALSNQLSIEDIHKRRATL